MKYLILIALGLLTQLVAATNLIEGSSVEFFGPDDLLLDPATNVIAVDVNGGSGNLEINGVTFQQDLGGPITVGDVTVNATAVNAIPNWQTAPFYTGIDQTSVDNLGLVMHSIRWTPAPGTVDVEVSGLQAGVLYNVQLLFSENGSGADRHWDIGIEDRLVVDDWTSVGPTEGGGISSPSQAYAYTGAFAPGEDGILNITMGQEPFPGDPNNTPPAGADNNPILQAVILHVNSPPTAATDIVLSSDVVAAGVPIGSVVGKLTSVDPTGGSHTYSLVAGDGDTDNASFEIDGDEIKTAVDLSALGGSTLSLRVQSTDEGDLAFEKAMTITVNADGDGDGLEDAWELMFGSLDDFTGLASGPGPGAGTGDFDDDGSPDSEEFDNGTDPKDEDSDDDGSNDGDEETAGTNPLNDDSDNDGLNDGDEATNMTNPLNPDSDDDTLNDGAEVEAGTNPNKKDSDEDGVDDNLDPDPLDPEINSFTTVFVGDIIEFSGPDDLNLDPASAVIAVNLFGDVDRDVSGVTFLEDNSNVGTVTQNGVTVTTTALNQIPDWAAPQYSGDDATSVDNLNAIMASIRWTPAPDPIAIDISGLNPGATYEIQFLTNEGRLRGRHWDIAVEDILVVDNYTSSGREFQGAWTPNNGYAYVAEFEAPADGILNIDMRQQIGGIEPRGTDNNPILQGIVVHETGAAIPLAITNLDYNPSTGTSILTWNSRPGANYILEFSTTMLEPWDEIDDGIGSGGETTTFQDPFPRNGPVGFYRVTLAR